MKVGLVSTHPPIQCGIATYTRKLSAALAATGAVRAEILSERGGAAVEESIPVTACFARADDYGPQVAAAAEQQGLGIAHFQHAPDIFGVGGRLIGALERLSGQGIATVVTLHTVFTRWSGLIERKPLVAGFHQRLGRAADAIVVHSETSAEILESHGVPYEKVVTIAHGTDEALRGDAAAGRQILGVDEGDRVLLFFGFVHVQKNVHVLLRALPRVVARVPDAKLAIVGKPGGDAWYNRLYTRWLRRLARRLGVERSVVVVERFVDEDEARHVHAASEMVLLPHAQSYGSASGVVHNAMALGLPLICSRSIKFEEVSRHVSPDLLVDTHDERAWAELIIALLQDRDRRAEIAARVEAYARATRWSAIAASHVDLYRRLADQRPAPRGGP
jgi:glycosyltransferase involved in cell wall biosynthesis